MFSPTDFAEVLLNLLIKFQNIFGFESMLFLYHVKLTLWTVLFDNDTAFWTLIYTTGAWSSVLISHSLKAKRSLCHYVVMTRSETKLSVAIPAPVSGQSAVNVATATSKCSITFLLPYDQDGDVKTKQDNFLNIL